MDLDRRRLLRLAGGAAAALAGGGRTLAAAAESIVALGARSLEREPLSRLSYGDKAETRIIRIAKDARLSIRLDNALNEPTGIDWHGLRLPNRFEVVPGLVGSPVAPAGDMVLDIAPTESGTSWFHPPFVPGWSDQTARGLSGVLIVEEAAPPAVDDDLVLFLTDRTASSTPGLSQQLAVNGQAWPLTKSYAPGARLRLRLVNGSTRQALMTAFEGARVMVIAIDGQPSELFRPLNDRLPVGPGARFDVLVDLPRTAGQTFKLLLNGMESSPETSQPPQPPLFVARLDGAARPERSPVVALDPNPALPRAIPLEKAKRIEIAIRRSGKFFAINDATEIALSKAPLFSVKRHGAVTLGFSNLSTEIVGFRPHGHVMRLLHRLDDGWEPYWRDSILIPPGKTAHAAFVADNPGRWPIESPFFDQAVGGLRRWFEVV